MKLSYYTIDDLRLGYDPQGEKGWRVSRFLDLRDTLEQYRSLPDDAVKVIGISNGEQDLEEGGGRDRFGQRAGVPVGHPVLPHCGQTGPGPRWSLCVQAAIKGQMSVARYPRRL